MLIRRKRFGKFKHVQTGDFRACDARPITEDKYYRLKAEEEREGRKQEEDDRRRNDGLREILGSDCPK